jgi:transposase
MESRPHSGNLALAVQLLTLLERVRKWGRTRYSTEYYEPRRPNQHPVGAAATATPPQKPTRGHPAHNHRRMVHGLVWILRTGAPWRDVPERYGPWPTVPTAPGCGSASVRRCKPGLMRRARSTGKGITWMGPRCGRLSTRQGQKKGPGGRSARAEPEGFSTKVHVRAEGGGKLMTFLLTPGQRHDASVFDQRMAGGAVTQGGPGRPKRRPSRVVGDKGDSSRQIRQYLARHHRRLPIPLKRHECRTGPFDRAIYRERQRVERLINRCQQFRRLATRDEKRAENDRAMWLIAAIL